jgi:hypothetical protein
LSNGYEQQTGATPEKASPEVEAANELKEASDAAGQHFEGAPGKN